MPNENEKTDAKEFDKIVQLLPSEPYMIPLQRHSKDPDVPKGESWKDPKYRLTTVQARERLSLGLNVGIVATGGDLVLFDHDDLAKFVFSKETLTVKTRNGKLHKYFLNGGDVENADGKGQYANCGEVRAKWKYVVAPGSFVPSDSAEGDGLYRVIEAKPLATLHSKELPAEFQPAQKSAKDVHVQSVALAGSFRNQYGWSIEDIRGRDDKLDGLLSNSDVGYPSASEADMATLAKLLYWGYTESEAVEILKYFRDREKLKRTDYIQSTLAKIRRTNTIADYVDVKKWHPKIGYKKEEKAQKNLIFSPPPRGGYISEDATKPMSLADVAEALSVTLKRDHENKLMVFLGMLMNYSGDDQQNILFNAPSSTGKSYIALEIAKLFPSEDVDKKGYTSPTSFFHVMGQLSRIDGEPLEDRNAYIEFKLSEWDEAHPRPSAPDYNDKSPEAVKARRALSEWKAERKTEYRKFKEEWDRIEKIYVVSLEKRILIFKDQPHDRVLQVLRSMLSHDEKVLEVDITDKTKEGGHRTKKIRVIGLPTVVFCSASFSLNEQERTRFWILSPDMGQDKLKDSLKLQVQRLSDKAKFEAELCANEKRTLLMQRIRAIKESNVTQVIIPQELAENLLTWFTGGRDLSARDQRDFPRLIDLVKAHALFQMFQRERIEAPNSCSVIANQEDVDAAKELLNKVLEANRLGLPPYVHKFYFESLEPAIGEDGITRGQFNKLYFTQFKERLGEKARKQLIDLLSEAGFIEEKTDPQDKRRMKIYIPLEGVEKKQKICGECELFHKPSCVFPAMNFDKVSEDSKFASDCRSFTPKKEAS